MKDYYGEDLNYIHLKFGDMRKRCNFTDDFVDKYPVFYQEFVKYYERDPSSKFDDPLQIVNYVELWGIPVEFYFNYTDTPASSIEDVKQYFVRERYPRDYGVYKDGKMTGWDGEEAVETTEKIVLIVGKKVNIFKDVNSLAYHVKDLPVEDNQLGKGADDK